MPRTDLLESGAAPPFGGAFFRITPTRERATRSVSRGQEWRVCAAQGA
jgi:hypothetical protein